MYLYLTRACSSFPEDQLAACSDDSLDCEPRIYIYTYIHMYISMYIYTYVCVCVCIFSHERLAAAARRVPRGCKRSRFHLISRP